ncbi:MAG: tetratricopeptide repeat protein [Kiloniellales bacterium]
MTEDIVTCLARDRTLAVSTPCGLLAAEASAGARAQLGQAEESRYLLEGGVRRAGDRLFVTIRLTDALTSEHLWAERCEQGFDTKLAVDEQIARRISAVVRGEVEAAEARRASASPESERDAWAHYHLGLREMYRFTPAGLAAAHGHFERAVALDPDFAAASARLAYAHIQSYWYGPADRRPLALDHAKAAAIRAIGLDRKNALGHLALGRVHALRREFDLAVNAFETAIRLNPSLAQAYFALGQAHFYAGVPKDAVRLLETAMALDPHDPHFWSFLHDQSDAYYALEELDEAARRAAAASRYPNATHWPLASLASALGTAGRGEEARDALIRLRTRWPDYTLSSAGAELAHFGNTAYVQQYLQGLQAAGLS